MRAIVTGPPAALAPPSLSGSACDGADLVLLDVSRGRGRHSGGGGWEPVSEPTPVAMGLVADVSDETACAAAVDRAVSAIGGVDVLVNNAGSAVPTPTSRGTSLAEFRRVLDVNLTGTFLMCRAVAKVMIGQASGGQS